MYSDSKNKFRKILEQKQYTHTQNYRGSNQSEKDFPGTINPLLTRLPHDPMYKKDIQNRELIKASWKASWEITGLASWRIT